MKYIVTLVAAFFFSINLFPQQFTNWENYSDMKITKDLAISSDGIWAATEGGAYFYNPIDNTFKTYHKSVGLNGISLSAVAIDNYNKVWFGSEDGMIDIYDPTTNSFSSILDIFNSDKTIKKINNITISGDTVYVATDFGISLIDCKNFFFYDTFFKFGSLSSNIKVNNIVVTDLIYVATDFGVAIQKTGATNLSDPAAWNVYNQSNGLPALAINKIAFYNNSLIAATDNGLSIFDGSTWQTFIGITNLKIIDLLVDGTNLYILTPAMVYQYDGSTISEVVSVLANSTKLAYSKNSELFIGTDKGLLIGNNFIFPNGPAANQFPNMVVDKNGTLWSSSGKDAGGAGFYSYNGTEWKTYDVANYPELLQNGFYNVFASSDNSIYAGNWGQGFIRLKNNTIERFDAYNTDMVGIQQNNNFVVITGFAEDSKNNIWILNLRAADKKSLYMLTPDTTIYYFQNPLEQQSDYSELKNLVIDQYGTKWYSMASDGTSGLFYFNEKGTYTDPTDDVYGYLSINKGLSSNTIFSLAVDRRGDLWVGTSLGVNIITNLNTVLTSANPSLKISTSFSVRQQNINAIAVDPLNQKWLGTTEGLFLLSTDGTQLLANVNSSNSPLLSDNISSIAINEKTGRVYVGTDAGLTSFDTPAILPVESFNGLNIYPNPFILKDGNQLSTIDGLIRDTDIKIVSVSGKLVKEFSSPGGRVAFWDGKDSNGDLVSTGVYIVIAFDREGNSVTTGKIAVLRE